MMNLSDSIDIKGTPTCDEQVIPSVVSESASALSGNCWCAERNNSNNAWYVNLGNGNVNNNNTYNGYYVCPSLELIEYADLLLLAEEKCWSNKHSSPDAVRYHYHIGRIAELVKALQDGYKPIKSICFVLSYPVYREVFASNYRDRIVHHLVADELVRIANKIHTQNGNVSHGNRCRYSAHTGATQILRYFKEHSKGYVMKVDVQGFFMSIDKEVVWSVLCEYADGNMLYKDLMKTLIFHNPTEDCDRRSPASAWDYVADNKSLFKAGGKGLPIGNYYSQLIANLLLAKVDEVLKGVVCETRFVDDICIVADTKEELVLARRIIKDRLDSIKLKIHPKKLYFQPVSHGVNFCGRTIKQGRIYINNRTIRACKNVIRHSLMNVTLNNAYKLSASINSYFGIMSHCASYNRQKEMMQTILESDYKKWLYFSKKKAQLICRVKPKYQKLNISINTINELLEGNEIRQDKRREYRNRRGRRRRNKQSSQSRLQANLRE